MVYYSVVLVCDCFKRWQGSCLWVPSPPSSPPPIIAHTCSVQFMASSVWLTHAPSHPCPMPTLFPSSLHAPYQAPLYPCLCVCLGRSFIYHEKQGVGIDVCYGWKYDDNILLKTQKYSCASIASG